MRVPKPRLRQVFEHTTHFKVPRPGQNPLVIAKSAISPGMQMRLRKFARGTGPLETPEEELRALSDEAAQTPEQSSIVKPSVSSDSYDALLKETETAAKAVNQFEKDVSSGMDEKSAMQTMTSTLKDVSGQTQNLAMQAAKSRIATKTEQASEEPAVDFAKPKPVAKPAPAPVELTPRMKRSLARLAALPDEPEAAESTPAPAPVAAPASVPVVAPAPIVAPAPAPAPAAAPAVPASVVAPVAPVTPAAPVPAVPAVAAAPAPVAAAPAKPAGIVIPQGITQATPDALTLVMAANPKATPAQAAEALVAKMQGGPALPTEFVAPEEVTPVEEGALGEFDAARKAKAAALVEQAKQDFDEKQELVRITQQQQARMLEAAKKDADVEKSLAGRAKSLEDAYDKFELKSFWSRIDTPQKIGSTIALAIGGFLSGATNTPNYVYDAFNKAVDRDLKAQEKNFDSILNQYKRVLGDLDDAKKLARADLLNLSALELKSVEARSNLRGIAPQLQKLRAEMDMEAIKMREEVRKKMYDADVAEANAQTQEEYRQAQIKRLERAPAAGATSWARLDLAQQRFKWAQENRAQSSEWSIPDPQDPTRDIIIKSVSPTVATSARREIGQRVSALQRVEKLDNFLAQIAASGNSIDPNTVREVQTQLAEVVENYPSLSKGTTQMVTQAQAQLLKGATESTPIPYVRYTDFLGLTKTAIEKLREEGVNNLSLSVRSNAKPGDAGAAEFASKFGARGYRGRTGVGRAPAPAPAAPQSVAPDMVKVRSRDGRVGLIPRANLAEAIRRGATEIP